MCVLCVHTQEKKGQTLKTFCGFSKNAEMLCQIVKITHYISSEWVKQRHEYFRLFLKQMMQWVDRRGQQWVSMTISIEPFLSIIKQGTPTHFLPNLCKYCTVELTWKCAIASDIYIHFSCLHFFLFCIGPCIKLYEFDVNRWILSMLKCISKITQMLRVFCICFRFSFLFK